MSFEYASEYASWICKWITHNIGFTYLKISIANEYIPVTYSLYAQITSIFQFVGLNKQDGNLIIRISHLFHLISCSKSELLAQSFSRFDFFSNGFPTKGYLELLNLQLGQYTQYMSTEKLVYWIFQAQNQLLRKGH